MMRVLLRADASTALGTGHVMRCLALADALRRRGAACSFAMQDLPGHLFEEVAARGHQVLALPVAGAQPAQDVAAWLSRQAEVQTADARRTLDVAGHGARWHWVVVDHYAFGSPWEDMLRPFCGHLLAIDDLADRRHTADLLLDQNPQRPGRYDALVAAHSRLLLGPAYALLREEFAEARKHLRVLRAHVARPSVLVSLGGADADGVALDAVAALRMAGWRAGEATVIAGGRNPHAAALASACAQAGFVFQRTTDRMAACLAEAGLCIGAGGTSLLERLALGVPTLLVPIAENQRPGSQAAAAAGAVELVDVSPADRVAAIAAALARLASEPDRLAQMSQRAAALCDARGAGHVASLMQQMALRLSLASALDGQRLHAWRNAPETRRHSGDGAPIDLPSHLRWFETLLADPARRLWIAHLDDAPVGVVRFDTRAIEGGRAATISVYRVPGVIGRGWGREIIAAGVEMARREWPDLHRIDARISQDNFASLRAFAACGFVPGADAGLHHLDLRSTSN